MQNIAVDVSSMCQRTCFIQMKWLNEIIVGSGHKVGLVTYIIYPPARKYILGIFTWDCNCLYMEGHPNFEPWTVIWKGILTPLWGVASFHCCDHYFESGMRPSIVYFRCAPYDRQKWSYNSLWISLQMGYWVQNPHKRSYTPILNLLVTGRDPPL